MDSKISGVSFHELNANEDRRGALTELYHEDWLSCERPVQWNFVRSEPNVLRGVHCHVRHHDFLTVTGGELILGLVDLRRSSPTFMESEVHRVHECAAMVVIPPGVAHGFYFEVPSQLVYGVSHYWNRDDELGCRWDDPDLGIDWPCTSPELSVRDQNASSLEELIVSVTIGLAAFGF